MLSSLHNVLFGMQPLVPRLLPLPQQLPHLVARLQPWPQLLPAQQGSDVPLVSDFTCYLKYGMPTNECLVRVLGQ